MSKLLKEFWNEEDGMGVVEVVLIIAVLVTIALIFRNAIIGFIKKAIEGIFGDGSNANKATQISITPTPN